ncbi:MAG: GIY-YIG nuclease family protein [Spirochaetota bacterium]
MSYYVYMLECTSGKYYTGYAINLEKRLKQHVSGKGGAKFTRSFRPLKLLAAWEITGAKGDAIRIELLIKSRTRDEKIALIKNPVNLIEMIAEKYADNNIGIKLIPVDNIAL